MDLHHLRTFVIVAEEENVTRAARRLYMTPPTVSGHIKALEASLGVQLFRRVPGGMDLTEKGSLLREKALATLQSAQDLVNHATAMQAHLMGTLSIGIQAQPSFLKIPALLTQLGRHFPGIDLVVETAASGAILRAVAEGRLDGGFIFGDGASALVAVDELASAELIIAAPLKFQSDLQTTNLAHLPWIQSQDDCPFKAILHTLFGSHYEIALQSNDEATKLACVKAGLGLSLLERGEAEKAAAAGDICLRQGEPIYSPLRFAYAANRENDPLLRALRQTIQALWQMETQND